MLRKMVEEGIPWPLPPFSPLPSCVFRWFPPGVDTFIAVVIGQSTWMDKKWKLFYGAKGEVESVSSQVKAE